jgi:hypothetical protein
VLFFITFVVVKTKHYIKMEDQQQIIIVTNPRDLADTIEKAMRNRETDKPEPKFSEKLSRAEAARFAGVSYLTFSKWVNKGLIKEHGFAGGKKRFFFKQEIIEALKKED